MQYKNILFSTLIIVCFHATSSTYAAALGEEPSAADLQKQIHYQMAIAQKLLDRTKEIDSIMPNLRDLLGKKYAEYMQKCGVTQLYIKMVSERLTLNQIAPKNILAPTQSTYDELTEAINALKIAEMEFIWRLEKSSQLKYLQDVQDESSSE